ncbi:hypothetical protein HK099_003412 [Clydaea vesicula]|uniref:Velvet domain-containing protein n=1 Tax=Clydaea vesicula TaxID=447962 RepID=A0AAD5TSM9_9FUNG|nr:hypothetical protein HK099_003412 [Clydaea vesicula]KAJ3377824.1 hypothetical protein HDU92_007942 [Lobulomyces angularis]
MSGNVGTERRTIDPPPIIELQEFKNGEYIPIIEALNFVYVRASLYDRFGNYCLNDSQTNASRDFPNLLGEIIEPGLILDDEFGNSGTFFIFKDLSVRSPGVYMLKFILYNLESQVKDDELTYRYSIDVTLSSPIINILKPKDFPGMMISSDITKAFKNQGLKLTIRNRPLHT